MFTSRLEPDVRRDDDVFSFMVRSILTKTPFIYSKINHGFWERLVAIEAEGFDIREPAPDTRREMDRLEKFHRVTPHMFEGGFVEEMLSLLENSPKRRANYIFSAGLLGWPGRLETAGITHDEAVCLKMIERYVSVSIKHPTANGMEFKRAIINSTFIEFVRAVRTRKTLLVGNQNLSRYFEFIGHSQGEFLEIHPSRAREARFALLHDIEARLDGAADLKLILLQAGGSLSAWLIHHLYQKRPDVTLIDIGLGSLICNPEALFPTAFGRIYRKQLQDCIESVHSGWLSKSMAKPISRTILTGRSDEVVSVLEKAGIDGPTHFFDPKVAVQRPIPFHLIHTQDALRINQIRKGQIDHRQLTSDILKDVMGLPDEDKIILCRSKAEALRLAEVVLSGGEQDNLNWVSNALSTARLILDPVRLDCDKNGSLLESNLEILSDKNLGMIYNHDGANISSWARLRKYCERSKIPLIIDNARSLLDRPLTNRPSNEIEVLSCNGFLPWGVSDATAIILSSDQMRVLEQSVKDEQLLPVQTSCELLDVLERYERVSFFYQRQARRIRQLVARNLPGLKPWLHQNKQKSPIGHLKFISNRPLQGSNLSHEFFEIQRPYKDIPSEYVNAKFLSERLISIPCHPMMRHVSNHDFIETVKMAVSSNNLALPRGS
ncbi:hypothetical protein [Litorimonas sp. WD9-15]|uniref:hypothetical protein n=1 Tax=Litorimonas sp. WD9-15 TaxID=3418716 RepID=UPI003D007672